ncbi:copper ion-binding protein [Vitreoscilla sp. C1]|uniref:copper ion binding protein n=1 Tax=Vitreoscilla sp. (strain C1) TaxID=96942 RepID=UPI000CDC1C75|nr:copper ion binding protein [Vitreoscilla sp. C1]AUZ05691.1 copper ion-binding protein [Vitreoscilla sp. C1]
MSSSILKVQGVTCQHCVKAIEKRVSKLDGVSAVAVNLANAQVDVQFDESKVSLANIHDAIVDEGYVIND